MRNLLQGVMILWATARPSARMLAAKLLFIMAFCLIMNCVMLFALHAPPWSLWPSDLLVGILVGVFS